MAARPSPPIHEQAEVSIFHQLYQVPTEANLRNLAPALQPARTPRPDHNLKPGLLHTAFWQETSQSFMLGLKSEDATSVPEENA